ncbi:hypothetical protein IKZ40_02995 [bacterium]|nr:hypothetical protein [bacterium]
MLKKLLYIFAVILLAAAVFILWSNSGSRKEMQKLRAQIYDLQKQVEKQNAALAEEKQEKKAEPKEERKISSAVTAPSQTPPSVVRPGGEAAAKTVSESKDILFSGSDSNDFAQSLTEIQEEIKDQVIQDAMEELADNGETNASKNIDMSQIDAIIREAEEKLVSQYGEKILEKSDSQKAVPADNKAAETVSEKTEQIAKTASDPEKSAVKTVVGPRDLASREEESQKKSMSEMLMLQESEQTVSASVKAPEAATTAPTQQNEQVVSAAPSWQNDELPGSRPVARDASLEVPRAPTQIGNHYSSSRHELRPVHGDAPAAAPSWNRETASAGAYSAPGANAGAAGDASAPVQRTTSLRPASEVIVPMTAKEEVERDIRAEEARRRPPERIRRIPSKNYNALGNKTMSDVMKEGL